MIDYFKKIIYLAQVDKDDQVLGEVERWQAHQKGILHRGFTVILFFNNRLIFQKRRHLVFDGYWDLSFSSHPIFIDGKLQNDKKAIFSTLKREWIIEEEMIDSSPYFLDKFYYKAKDEKSGLTEHEIDYLYLIKLKKILRENKKYAYELKVVNLDEINKVSSIYDMNLAPWVDLKKYQRLILKAI